MTEKEKMLAGEIYSAVDPQLIEELTEVKELAASVGEAEGKGDPERSLGTHRRR